jgi:hypothetical protein
MVKHINDPSPPDPCHTRLEMQAEPLPVVLPPPSSSKKPPPKADETHIELATGGMCDTWNDEIYELSFFINNPENAIPNFMYTSDAVSRRGNPKARVAMRLANKKHGFYIQIEQVSRII